MNKEIIWVDLNALSHEASQNGPQWGLASEDLNATLLWWDEAHTPAPHVNNEVDVFLLVVEGSGEVVVDGQAFPLTAGQAILLPKGTERTIRSATPSFCYLNVHRRRRLMPTLKSGNSVL